MPFSSGTFTRTFDCTTDRDNGVKILASKFDTEFDGIATGLSTCILKDGTQTCTAAIPFAEGLTIPDNKTIVLGTNSDITIQYDETTNDSLEIAANVEGAALGVVLKADQGDDNADQHKLNIADGGVLTLQSKISGGFVTYLTHTPNATVANSTTAVAGNLTVAGDLTLGSGGVINEAELEVIDGITAGTVAASKAVIVDSNKDIASFRNVTLTGELDAGSLDISGDADIDGTLEADAMTLNGTAITATATLDTGISNNNVPKFTSGVADNDFLRVDGTAIEGRSASEVLSDIAAMPLAGGTFSGDVTFTGDSHNIVFDKSDDALEFADNAKATFGTGSDLTITHDGSDSLITDSGTGNLQIRAEDFYVMKQDGSEVMIRADTDSFVKLFHDGSEKLATTSTGIDVTGTSKSDLVVVDSTGGATPSYSHTNNGEGITLRYNDDSGARAADIVATGNNPAGATTAMRFFVNPNSTDAASEVMRLQNGGLLVGTTTASMTGLPDARLRSHANGKTGLIVSEVFQNEYGIVVQASSNSGSRFAMLFINGGLGTSGSITQTQSAVAFNTSSDYRLKENVVDMTGAIARVKQLAPKRFNFIEDADNTVDGFLAHEAQAVVPEAVTGKKDETREVTNSVLSSDGKLLAEDVAQADWTAGKLATTDDDGNAVDAIYPSDSTWSAKHTEPVMQGIDQSKLVPLLTAALREAIAKIETLETKVAALEAGS